MATGIESILAPIACGHLSFSALLITICKSTITITMNFTHDVNYGQLMKVYNYDYNQTQIYRPYKTRQIVLF